jgi:hypothetical protein
MCLSEPLREGRATTPAYPTPNTNPLVIDVPSLGPLFGSIDLVDSLVSPEVIANPVTERSPLEPGSSAIYSQHNDLVLAYEVMRPVSGKLLIDRLRSRSSIRIEKHGILLSARGFKVGGQSLDDVDICGKLQYRSGNRRFAEELLNLPTPSLWMTE